jgi:hypothetical protein
MSEALMNNQEITLAMAKLEARVALMSKSALDDFNLAERVRLFGPSYWHHLSEVALDNYAVLGGDY